MASTASPQHSMCSNATSGAQSRQRSIVASGLSTSTTSWPASLSTLAIRRRFGVSAWANSTLIPLLYPVDGPPILERPSKKSDQPRDLRDIALHLLDQGLGRVEAPLAADPVHELQAQLAAVEVVLEIEQERLD